MGPGPSNFFGIKVSKTGIPVQNASDKQLVYKDDFSTKTYFDQTNSRMIEGLLPDGNYGLWVSKPGFNVTTATENELIFNSTNNIFKIVSTGTANIIGAGFGLTSTTVSHSQPQIPIIFAFVTITGVGIGLTAGHILPYNYWIFSGPGIVSQFLVDYQVNKTSIDFNMYDSDGTWTGANADIRYYIVQETAAAS